MKHNDTCGGQFPAKGKFAEIIVFRDENTALLPRKRQDDLILAPPAGITGQKNIKSFRPQSGDNRRSDILIRQEFIHGLGMCDSLP